MPRALHHLDLWVRDLAVARGEWGWLLGELGWAVDLEDDQASSWQHDDGTYFFLQRVPEDTGGDDASAGSGFRGRVPEVPAEDVVAGYLHAL